MTTTVTDPARPHPHTSEAWTAFAQRRPIAALFLISVLGLFLEMLCIRYVGTEVRIFAYVQNTVLVVCFLGLGMGCFAAKQKIRLRGSLVALGLLLLLSAVPFTRGLLHGVSAALSVLHDLLIWYDKSTSSPSHAVLYVVAGLTASFLLMVLVWHIFFPLGQLLGNLFDRDPRPIRAYSVNVFGSLVGIWLFALLCALCLPPVVWFVAAALLFLPFLWDISRRRRVVNLILLLAVVALGGAATWTKNATSVVWSPYQKLVLTEKPSAAGESERPVYDLSVNNVPYQGLLNLSPQYLASLPDMPNKQWIGLSLYDVPFLLHPDPRKVLLVGAGSGNDAAGALRSTAETITAVEIDPAIVKMGQQYHPEDPYSSPRVKVIVDDARSFFAVSKERFDVISFGLLDSHTTVGMTNARLDHYVYTRESLARARSLLAPGGILSLTFAAQRPYIADRIARALRDVFGEEPIAFPIPSGPQTGWGGLMFVAGDFARINAQIAANPQLDAAIAQWRLAHPTEFTYSAKMATDDWPYLYLARPTVPVLYYLFAFMMIGLFFYGVKRSGIKGVFAGWTRSHSHFFLLGAAFLLLEVQNISKAAVALGSTWMVNAVIVSGVLIMILLANLAAASWRRLPLRLVGWLLIASCLMLYFLDIAQLAFLPFAQKAVIVGGLATVPMFFSGILFIWSFAGTADKAGALGANLFGALIGGILQSVSFVVGIKALLLLVALLYLGALISRPKPVAAS